MRWMICDTVRDYEMNIGSANWGVTKNGKRMKMGVKLRKIKNIICCCLDCEK